MDANSVIRFLAKVNAELESGEKYGKSPEIVCIRIKSKIGQPDYYVALDASTTKLPLFEHFIIPATENLREIMLIAGEPV